MRSRQIRRIFFVQLLRLLRVLWPILTGVFFAMVVPGLLIGHIEKWRIVLTGLVAAVSVEALRAAARDATE
jgi:hypothetical protein